MTLDEYDTICAERSELSEAVQNVATLNRRDAGWLADRVLEAVIAQLRRDPHLPPRSTDSWWATLAPTRERLTELFAAVILGRADLEEILTTIDGMP